MRFIFLVKSNPGNEADGPPAEGLVEAMDAYNKALNDAGVFVAAEGYDGTARGAVVREDGGKQTVNKGPFGDPYGLVAGTTTVQVKDLDAAIELARKMPNIGGKGARHEVEIRPLFG
jgi:hypothetical protein